MRIVLDDGRIFLLNEEFSCYVRDEGLSYQEVQGLITYMMKYYGKPEEFNRRSKHFDDDLTYDKLEEIYVCVKELHE